MSEQPNNVVSLDDYRQGSRFNDDTQVDLQKSTLPYDATAIAKVHQIEEARLAREAAYKAQQEMLLSGPEIAQEMLANLEAVRKAVIGGNIQVSSQSNIVHLDNFQRRKDKRAA